MKRSLEDIWWAEQICKPVDNTVESYTEAEMLAARNTGYDVGYIEGREDGYFQAAEDYY